MQYNSFFYRHLQLLSLWFRLPITDGIKLHLTTIPNKYWHQKHAPVLLVGGYNPSVYPSLGHAPCKRSAAITHPNNNQSVR